MPQFQVEWALVVGPIEADSKIEAEQKARQMVYDDEHAFSVADAVQFAPIVVSELDENGDPIL